MSSGKVGASSTGNPVVFSALSNAPLVVLTAAASLRGFFALERIRLSTSGFFARNTSIGKAAFLSLQHRQARVRLDALLLPPLDFGWMCSICKGTFSAAQYAHFLPHFSSRQGNCRQPAIAFTPEPEDPGEIPCSRRGGQRFFGGYAVGCGGWSMSTITPPQRVMPRHRVEVDARNPKH